MSQNKRSLRKTGLAENKKTSIEQIKAARQGGEKRVEQYIVYKICKSETNK